MCSAPILLNDDGSASIATVLLMSHHGLRRDIARFSVALEGVARGDLTKVEALRQEWQTYRSTLHGHHQSEDLRLFPHVLEQQPSLASAIDQLRADHGHIDPLLERGDRAFAELPDSRAATEIVGELASLLHAHLTREEGTVLTYLRDMKVFPPLGSEAERDMYAQGFAWSSHGIHPEVLARVYAMLPDDLTERLPAARAAFAARCERVWGTASAGASRSALPDFGA